MNKKWLSIIGFTVSFPSLASPLTTYGDIAQIGIPLTGAAVAIFKEDYQGFWQLTEGAVYTAAATHALKYTLNHTRPNGGNYSFPSGHTSAAFQGASFLQMRYGYQWGVPAYALSALVGYSRVRSDSHHWRDVVAGAALASGIQYLITRKEMGLSNYYYNVSVDKQRFQAGVAYIF